MERLPPFQAPSGTLRVATPLWATLYVEYSRMTAVEPDRDLVRGESGTETMRLWGKFGGRPLKSPANLIGVQRNHWEHDS